MSQPTKYRAQPIIGHDGRRYPSRAEARRAAELDLLARAGVIRRVKHQPQYALGCPENVYVADFEITDAAGHTHAEDVKGFRTAKFRRDCRLWRHYGPYPLHVLTARGSAWHREIIPGAQEEARWTAAHGNDAEKTPC